MMLTNLSLVAMDCFLCGHEHFMGRESFTFKLHDRGYWLSCETEGCSCELGRKTKENA